MSLATLAAISLGFVQLPGTPMQWLWGFVVLSICLVALSQSMNSLAGMFTECPHCHKVVRKAQQACNHCLTPIEHPPALSASERVVPRAGKSKTRER